MRMTFLALSAITLAVVALSAVLAAASPLCVPAATPGGLCTLSAEAFTKVTSTTAGNPAYWVIRIRAPWDVVSSPDLLAEVAQELANGEGGDASSPFVHIGEMLLDSTDAWAIADGLGLQQFPTVISFSGKTMRATAPRGAMQYGKVLSLPRPILVPSAKSSNGLAELRKMILSNVPTRYLDPVTGAYVDALNFVFSRKEIYQMSALKKEQATAPQVLSTVPARAVVLRLRLSEGGDEALLAAASAAAVEAGPRVVVFVTEDADVAARFQIHHPGQGSVFAFPFPDDVSEAITPLFSSTDDVAFQSPAAVAKLIASAVNDDDKHLSTVATTLKKWRQDVTAVGNGDKPLRHLLSQADFFTHIVEAKVSIGVLFFLRESDDFFTRGYHVAEEIAKAIQTQWGSTIGDSKKPHPLAATRDRVRFEAYWIDAELQKSVAASFKIPSVPSVAFLYNLQDGRRGVRFVQGGKKSNEFPTTSELLAFMSGSALTDVSKDLFPLDLSGVTFLSDEEVVSFYRSRAPKAFRVTAPPVGGAPALPTTPVTDVKVYLETEVNENPFVSQMVEGKVKFDSKNTADAVSSKKGTSTSKLSPKAEAKKKKKQEAEKKKIEDELAEKKRAKEERMKKKAEEDEARRVDEKVKAKTALKEERKKQKISGDSGSGGASSSSGKVNTNTVERPKFSPAKGPKNRHLQKRDWEVDRKVMLSKRLKGSSFNAQFEL
ncbi:membrane-associated protein, putative [Bodo saltans]|uniref:Membrane-associated protein, putative n=1 Tax=Bodo saltans TaxID=75058 RepID=A0A0S4J6X7_BODSA|nr:membrane-associated protein, putative [Bodo saltans]|eukprot:CUG74724.1 membrane-associated protein, putative [Bodo saltans]